jgi:hypothetical protein
MSDNLGPILSFALFVLIGAVIALPLLLLRRVLMRSEQGRLVAISFFSLASFILLFGLMGIIAAQIPIVFVCTAADFEPCYAYAQETGLESSDAFERLATEELTYRTFIPPLFQQPCHIDESAVCTVLDKEEWADTSGSFWLNVIAGLLSGGGTAVTLLFFTRKRANVGKAASSNGRFLRH